MREYTMPTASGTPTATARPKPARTSVTVTHVCSSSSPRALMRCRRICDGGGRMNSGTRNAATPSSQARNTATTMPPTSACSASQRHARRATGGEAESGSALLHQRVGVVLRQRTLLLDAAALDENVERGLPHLLALPAERLAGGHHRRLHRRPHLLHEHVAL